MVVVDFRLALWEPKAVSARKAWYDVCHKLQVLQVFSRNCGAPQSSVLGVHRALMSCRSQLQPACR